MPRHFLKLTDFSRDELTAMLDLAARFKADLRAGRPHARLAGKTLGMIFEKSSTRTRVSFEVGMFQLGGHALFLSPRDTQIGRGEPISDTARVLSRYVDGIMIRTFAQATADELAHYATVPVINGLTDRTHPCQVLSDLLTVREVFGGVRDPVYSWIGDGNNMCNSWINAAAVFGFELRIACPPGHDPDVEYLDYARARGAKITLTRDPRIAVESANVINTDVWASMGQEAEAKERARVFEPFQVNSDVMAFADRKHIFLHCLPAHRGEEVTAEVIDGHHSVIYDQAENRLHAQKAIMATLLSEARAPKRDTRKKKR